MRTGDGRVDEMAWDGMGWVWQACRPVSVCVLCLCDCVTRGAPQVLVSTGLPIRDVVAGVLSDRQPSDGGYHRTPGSRWAA